MTPKEKAKQLFDNMLEKMPHPDVTNANVYSIAKRCALISVDEILKSEPLEPNNIPEWLQPEDWFSEANKSAGEYWLEVKQEIEKL